MNADQEETHFEWSLSKFGDIVLKEYFPSAVKHLSVQKDIITRFLNFYLGGRIQKGFSVEDVVFAGLSILPMSPYDESIIWTPEMYRDDGKAFFLTPEERLAAGSTTDTNTSDDTQLREEPEESSSSADFGDNSPSNSSDNNNIGLNALIDLDDFDSYNDEATPPLEASELERLEELFTEIVLIDSGIDSEMTDSNNDNVLIVDTESLKNSFREDSLKNIKFDEVPLQRENRILLLNYGPVENAAFIKYCNDSLKKWDNDKSTRTVLKSFFAVVAFVLMRATTKSYKHLVSTFHSEKFLRLIHHSIKGGFGEYSPPHKRCLKRAYRAFRRRDGKTPTMFAKLIALGVSDSPLKYLKYVVYNGLMNYTADYGFNLIRLLRTASGKMFGGDVSLLMELTLCKATEASWMRLTAFLREYFTNLTPMKSVYRWARVLDGNFFRDLSCKENYALAVILAVFIEKTTGDSGVWQATWVENEELETYRNLGNELYKGYTAPDVVA